MSWITITHIKHIILFRITWLLQVIRIGLIFATVTSNFSYFLPFVFPFRTERKVTPYSTFRYLDTLRTWKEQCTSVWWIFSRLVSIFSIFAEITFNYLHWWGPRSSKYAPAVAPSVFFLFILIILSINYLNNLIFPWRGKSLCCYFFYIFVQ